MRTLIGIITIFIVLMSPSIIAAYNDDITHPHITERAIEISNFDTYLQNNLGFTKSKDPNQPGTFFKGHYVTELLQKGSELEDDPACRASNHFHNPLLDWDVSGLADTLWPVNLWCYGLGSGQYPPDDISSNITWATGYLSSDSIIRDDAALEFNEWDWDSAREYFYTYLTGINFNRLEVAPDENSRVEYMTKCFRAVGQVLHLLQDASVPAHVRNDFSQGHTMVRRIPNEAPWKWIGNAFELYVKRNNGKSWFDSAITGSLTDPFLTQFWDTDRLDENYNGISMDTLGLAEYTNFNFLSAYTMFTDEFPFPKAEHCEIRIDAPPDSIPDLNRKYLSSTNGHPGEQINHLAIVSYLNYFRKVYFPNISNEKLPVFLNQACYEEYAEKLIPRAIGYSAQLLDYFFRGTIEITPPDDFIYSLIDGSATDQNFEHIKANLRNVTLDEEEMVDGTLVAIARYKRIINYSPDLSVEIEPGQPKQPNEPLDPSSREGQYSYSVSAQDTTLLQTFAPTEVNFDFTADPIPAGVTDLTLQVVFLGTLGNEVDTAVAVGMVDLTEPTHFTFFNSTDEIPNADGSALVPAANKGFPRDFIIAFTGMDPDADDGIENKSANFGFYETYDPLIVVEDLAPAAYFRIVALMDARQHAFMVMDSGDSAFCPPIWSFRESDGAVYQEDTSGDYLPGIQLKPTYCDTGQPFSHRGTWQHHTYYQYQCGETNCDYLLEQRSNVSETAIVSLSEKINFPNHVISYTPPTCAEPGGDLGKKMETRLCYP
jgi:hypothetical protein